MSEGFPTITLGTVASITMGQSPGSETYNAEEHGLPFLQGCAEFGPLHPQARIYSSLPLRVAKRDSILISVRAPVGTLNIADQDYCIGRGLGAVMGMPGRSITGFLQYAIKQNVHFLHRRSQGSTFLAVGSGDLKLLPVPSIGIAYQEQIAEILSALDATIDKTEALIAKYQQIKAGLMHDLFTRGITADGKLRPPREQAPELYQETPIGWIPKEWKLSSIRECVHVIDPNPSHRYPVEVADGIPICSTENFLGEDGFDISRSKQVPSHIFEEQDARCNLNSDDVVFARKGKIGLARRYGKDRKVFSHTVVILKSASTALYGKWLVWLARSEWMLKQIEKSMNTNLGVPTLGVAFIQAVKVPLPPSNEQLPISLQLDGITATIASETASLEKLIKQRSGLMHDLLTGKARVPLDTHAPEPAHV